MRIGTRGKEDLKFSPFGTESASGSSYVPTVYPLKVKQQQNEGLHDLRFAKSAVLAHPGLRQLS